MNSDFIIEKSKDEYDILKVKIEDKWKYIGSKYNQKREIDKFIESLGELSEKDNYIIFGLSLGEHIRELLKCCNKDSQLFIVEPNLKLIEFLKEENKIEDILKNNRVILCNNKNDIESFFDEYINETNINFLKLGVYSNYVNLYEKIVYDYKIIKEFTQKKILERNTYLAYSSTWFNILMDNLQNIITATPVNNLRNKYKNKPAIIVSAGPSLSKNVDYLKEVNGRALILSGGRTLKALVNKNIKSDCLVTIDPGETSYKLVKGYIDKVDSPILFYEGANSDIIRDSIGPKIISSHNKFIHKIFNEEIETINRGGSVAHSMTFFATYMGCNPIIFIGQDLAYTDEQLHANIALNKDGSDSFEKVKSDDDIYVKDINGNLVRTSCVLNTFKIDLESIIKENKEIEFIDATEGGAYIEGTKVKTLKEVVDNLNNNKLNKLEEFLDLHVNKKNEIISELELSLTKSKECKNICNDGIKFLLKFKKAYLSNNNGEMNNINKKLNKVDDKLKTYIGSLNILNSILFNVIYKINCDEKFVMVEDDSEEVKINKQLNKNKVIYKDVINILDICIPKIKETLKALKNN